MGRVLLQVGDVADIAQEVRQVHLVHHQMGGDAGLAPEQELDLVLQAPPGVRQGLPGALQAFRLAGEVQAQAQDQEGQDAQDRQGEQDPFHLARIEMHGGAGCADQALGHPAGQGIAGPQPDPVLAFLLHRQHVPFAGVAEDGAFQRRILAQGEDGGLHPHPGMLGGVRGSGSRREWRPWRRRAGPGWSGIPSSEATGVSRVPAWPGYRVPAMPSRCMPRKVEFCGAGASAGRAASPSRAGRADSLRRPLWCACASSRPGTPCGCGCSWG